MSNNNKDPKEINIRLINNLLKPYISITKKKNRYPLYYNEFLNIYYTNYSFDKIRKLKKISFSTHLTLKLYTKKRMTLYSNKKCILIKGINGIIVFWGDYVMKILSSQNEPMFLSNENNAYNKYPDLVPRLVDSGRDDTSFFTVSKYLKNEEKITWQQWPKRLPVLQRLLIGPLKRIDIQKIKVEDYKDEIEKNLNEISFHKKYLLAEYIKARDITLECINTFFIKDSFVFKHFTHGDLTPNNIIIHKRKYYIIDWANGGELNSFYDLMLQNFYWPNKMVWKNFKKISFRNNTDPDVFFGTSKNYINLIEDILGEQISEEQIRLLIIFSLAESLLKSFLRYHSAEEYMKGTDMIRYIEIIGKNILGKN